MSSAILSTSRLTVRQFTLSDAPFILELLNEDSFIRFIGDKAVRCMDDAERYLSDGALTSYEERGFGPYLVIRSHDNVPLGMCGLFQRADLEYPDLGFAFLKAHAGVGYATESSMGVIRYSANELGISVLAAIVDPDNERSVRLLKRLGFEFRSQYRMADEETLLHCYTCETLGVSGTL